MKKIIYYIMISCFMTSIAWSCGGDTPSEPPKPPVIPLPDAAALSSPADNSACLKGTSESGSTSTLTFIWNKGNNADSYKLEITNLLTKQITFYATSNLTYSVSLLVNMPYSWSVVSVNKTGTATSSVWKFYLSGAAASNYAPFPAELMSPASGSTINANGSATVKVTLKWTGSDVDNDISSYAVYLDNANASTQIIASQTETTTEQTLQSSKTYYWKVITTDKAGNKSTSVVNSFEIK